jgi:hypothetical protein
MKLDCEKNFEQPNPTKKTFLYAVPTTTALLTTALLLTVVKARTVTYNTSTRQPSPTPHAPERTQCNLVLSHHRTTCHTPPLIIENAFATKTAMIFILS